MHTIFGCENLVVVWLTIKNIGSFNSWEVEKKQIVWLTKTQQVALPKKFYFFQDGESRLPISPR